MLHYLKILRQSVTWVFLSKFYLSGFTVCRETEKERERVNESLLTVIYLFINDNVCDLFCFICKTPDKIIIHFNPLVPSNLYN